MDTPSFRLHITPAEGAPYDFSFQGETLVVGRSAEADLTLADPFLSRRHRDQGCATLADALDQDLEDFTRGVPYADDRTIVLARRLA